MGLLVVAPGRAIEFAYDHPKHGPQVRQAIFESLAYGRAPEHNPEEESKWYLNAWCMDKKARRTFEFSRISNPIERPFSG